MENRSPTTVAASRDRGPSSARPPFPFRRSRAQRSSPIVAPRNAQSSAMVTPTPAPAHHVASTVARPVASSTRPANQTGGYNTLHVIVASPANGRVSASAASRGISSAPPKTTPTTTNCPSRPHSRIRPPPTRRDARAYTVPRKSATNPVCTTSARIHANPAAAPSLRPTTSGTSPATSKAVV